MEYFKGDQQELRAYNSVAPTFNRLESERDLFFDEAFACYLLGEILHDSKRVPLSNAIPRDVFRESFQSIFEAFLEAGSFEGYIKVFTDIFGDTVQVNFTVPGPGRLNIDIVADSIVLENLIAREIINDAFVESDLATQANEDLVAQQIKGFRSQSEVETMLNEMVPNGIFTNITLTLGV